MKTSWIAALGLGAAMTLTSALNAQTSQPSTQPSAAASLPPFTLLKVQTVGGLGGWDYVAVDSDARRLYVPRRDRVEVYDADSLKKIGVVPNTAGVHGVALDTDAGKGFASNGSDGTITVFDLKTLATIKRVKVGGRPDSIIYDPFSQRIFSFSHEAPACSVLNSDGSIAGTIDLPEQPEYAVSDRAGHVYVNLEDSSHIAVIDPRSLTVSARWSLDPGKGPSGLALDVAHRRLFSVCHNRTMVILDADSGDVVATEPIGPGVDGAAFDPITQEAFSSNGDATLTAVKEIDPAHFQLEQNIETRPGARTCSLDLRTHHLYLVTAQFAPPSTQSTEGGGRRKPLPNTFMILVVGRP